MIGAPALARASSIGLFVGFGALVSACVNDDAALGLRVIPPPQETVSFERDVRPILTTFNRGGCTTAGCHGGGGISANLDLEKPFDGVVGAVGVTSCEAAPMKRIVPFASHESYLIRKLEKNFVGVTCVACDTGFGVESKCGEMMPFGSSGLASTDLEIIRDWIDQGAPDN